MILTYSNEKLKYAILAGFKIHTFRTDKSNRWKQGNTIQHWLGNPRNVKQKPKPHEFGKRVKHIHVCTGTQKVKIYLYHKKRDVIIIDGKRISDTQFDHIAINDGFTTWGEMRGWILNMYGRKWSGKIIHWTELKY